MRDHIARNLKGNANLAVTLSNELADIYHFHLHPRDIPNSIVRSDRFTELFAR